jgi:integrase
MARKPWPPKVYPRRGKEIARVWVDGRPFDRTLGPVGSEQARQAYARLCAELSASGGLPPAPRCAGGGGVRTVGELTARFLACPHPQYQRANASGQGELANLRHALAAVNALHRDTPVERFGPRALAEVRAAMVRGSWPGHAGKGWSRKVANRMVTRVRTVWGWAVREELIPGTLWHALKSLRPLEVGELGAREYEDVPPVGPEAFAAACARLSPVVRAMAHLQILTGARPGEVCGLRPRDLEKAERVRVGRGVYLQTRGCWVYRPARHKNAWRGQSRIILFGPKAQAVLGPFLDRAADAHLFSPREATGARLADRRAKRKSRVQPSQVSRARPDAGRKPGDRYRPSSYARAVWYACRRAGLPKEEWWTPNQLRHAAASALISQFGADGWEIARMALGHRSLETTRKYAVDPLGKVVEALLKVG